MISKQMILKIIFDKILILDFQNLFEQGLGF